MKHKMVSKFSKRKTKAEGGLQKEAVGRGKLW